MRIKKIPLTSIAIAVIMVASLLIDFSLKLWEKQDRVIEWDIHSHYAYLPALFIYDDIQLTKSDYHFDNDYYLFWQSVTPDGRNVIKTSMGMSILYAPFFFVAHGFASLTDYPENGFSEPYKFFLLLSSIFYLFIGLDYVRKILQHFNFSDLHIAITLLLIGLGTNLLCYSSQSAPLQHVYDFCLIAVFIFYTIRWYEKQSVKNTIILGLLLGMISLIRPTNVVILIFFGLYNVSSIGELKQRMALLKKEWFLINVILFLTFIVWIPQFIYWKTVTGSYLYYSYTGEGFFFNNPQMMEGLFGFHKGWLVYTPMMAFSIMGIFLLKDIVKKMRTAIILFFFVNIYIIFSWWCWWYGGTYGQRAMIDCYPILAIPFASFIQDLSGRKWFLKGAFVCIAAFFIWLNIFQTFQFEYHSLHWDGMTRELYFKQFGKISMIEDFEKYVKEPNYDKAKLGNRTDFTPPAVATSVIQNAYTKKKEESRARINLIAFNDKYVSADQLLKGELIANRDEPEEWETFTLIMFGKNECTLSSSEHYFVCAEINNESRIAASRITVGYWETFIKTDLDSNYVAFKAIANDKFLSVDENTGKLYARGETVGRHEKFKMIKK